MRKPNANSVLDSMPASQRAQLEAWLCDENISYKEAISRLLAEFKVSISHNPVSVFHQRCQARRTLDRVAKTAREANGLNRAFRDNPADIYSALRQMIEQLAFEAARQNGQLDIEQLKELASLALEARGLELKEREVRQDERRVLLLEKKTQFMLDGEKARNLPLTPEQKEAQVKQIFGIANEESQEGN